jgi:hypothetical protein
VGRDDRVAGAGLEGDLADRLDLGRRVRRERVDRDNRRHPEQPDVLDLLGEVRGARADRDDVLLGQGRVERLAGHDLPDPAVHLQRPNGGDDNRRVGRESGRPALDVEELLGAHVGAEAGLGADDLVRREGEAVRDDRVVAVGDVRERPAVDEGGAALQRLEQVRLDRIREQRGHRAGHPQVLGRHGRAVAAGRQHHPAEPRAEVVQVMGQSEDGHHLRGDGDHELGLARNAVLLAAEANDHPSDRAIADIDDAWPEDAERVDAERVAVVQVVVEERCPQVVGRADRVDVAGQVQVEVGHRDDLAVAAAGSSSLDPEDRPQRRLADADRSAAADLVEPLRQPDRRGAFALAERRGADRGDDDVLAARIRRLDPLDPGERDLGLRVPVRLDLVVV